MNLDGLLHLRTVDKGKDVMFLTSEVQNLQFVVLYTVSVIFFLVIIFFIFYLIMTYIHFRNNKYKISKSVQWHKKINSFLNHPNTSLTLSRKEKIYFRDFLIEEYPNKKPSIQKEIRHLYTYLGIFDQDIKQLKSPFWWKKVQAIKRLEILELKEAEEFIFPLLHHRKREIRFSAMRMLSFIQSKKLLDNIPKLFADNTRWTYRYIVNLLFFLEVSVENLKPLYTSSNKDLRKAAAILLGREGHKEAIPILKKLVNDRVKDVRREALYSLSRIGSDDAIPAFLYKFNDRNSQVRAAVARGLGKLKNSKTLIILDKLADDPIFEVRSQAFFSLKRFGEQGEHIIRKKIKESEIAREYLSK